MIQKNKNILIFLGIYFIIRFFSYFFAPATPLHIANPVNSLAAEAAIVAVIYLFWKKSNTVWYIIALEILLGGAGGYLSMGPLALRTCFLFVFILFYFGRKIREKKVALIYKENKIISIILLAIYVVVGFASIRGLALGHGTDAVFSDAVPYLFFLYYFPLKNLLKIDEFKEICFSAIIAAIIGNGLFVLFTLFGFSAGFFSLQDTYYHWYRDVALGKITDLGGGFFRLVLNEHLLLVPVLLYFIYKMIHENATKSYNIICGLLLLFILSVNLTRIYILALAVGMLFLFSKKLWKRWLAYCIGIGVVFMLIFTYTHLLATRGQNLGWEFFGLRVQSIAQPQIEDSSLSRMLLLPKIWEKIRTHPILGSGLADTVTVYSPVLKQEITTPHFDWGYFELWAELGIMGLVAWLILAGYILMCFRRNETANKSYLIGALICLAVTNITSPALFHVMGIVFLTYHLANLK